MVRTFIITLLLLTSMLSAGEFTASVRGKQVPLGKGFPLTLTLHDATAKNSPNISALQNQFAIHSQQKSSSTIVTNGKLSSSTSWKYTLIPSKEGVFTIPTIGIETNEGVLWTRPIDIEVVKPKASPTSTEHSDDAFIVTTHASKTTPYKDEPISYIVRFVSKVPFANVQMQKVNVENTIIEMIKEPSVYEKVVDGVKVYILQFPLLITPLKPGRLVIPPAMIQGEVPAKEDSRPRSFFDDGFNPFQMLGGLQRMEPFAVRTEETVLDVQPPVSGVQPWLPAASLKIDEQWDDNQKLQVGEPITRNIKISAEGLRAAQLPSLDSYIQSNSDFKIYSDKPETGENLSEDHIFSFRKEQYTIIPQKDGKIILPAIEIPWWDVNNETKAVAKLPARTIDVAPAAITPQKQTPPASMLSQQEPPQVTIDETSPLLYGVIAGLVILLVVAFVWVFSLQKKIGRLSETSEVPEEPVQERQTTIRFKELQKVKNPKELHEFLQTYSHNRWETPKNATVQTICNKIKEHTPNHLHGELKSIENSLENALYRDLEINTPSIAARFSEILGKTRNINDSSNNQEKLPELNPN